MVEDSVVVTVKPWYKSKLIWIMVVGFLVSAGDGIKDLTANHAFDWGHVISMVLTAAGTVIRARMPDLIAGSTTEN